MINFNKHKQAGGFFWGLIVGLVIGLAIAFGVALVITKTPVPFLSKLNKQDKPAALTPGQAADPNKPLYGNKEPAKEAAKEFAKEGDKTAAEQAGDAGKAPGTTPGSATPAADKPKAADGKTLAGAAAKEAQPGTPKTDNSDEKWVYYLQAGAFREQADADSAKGKLALAGFDASISERSAESGSLYRVRIGPFNQLEAMNRARVKLSDSGMDVAVIRIAK